MTVRQASSTLQLVSPAAPLVARDAPAVDEDRCAVPWTGAVRIDAERAAGLSAPRWLAHVRTGLLERALVLGADHWEQPHGERPETARRMLAHIDALAEAGLSPAELGAFAAEVESDRTGALYGLTILFGCLAAPGAAEAFEEWVSSLDVAASYWGIVEIAQAIRAVPGSALQDRARRWLGREDEVPCAIALEAASPDQLSGDVLSRAAKSGSALARVALERLLVWAPNDMARGLPRIPPWVETGPPSLCYEVARALLLRGDPGPLARLRERDGRALSALGARAIDVLALAGDARDEELAVDLACSCPTTPDLLAAMGRLGLRSVFPRLLAELGSDDFEEDAHAALVTALGPRVSRPSPAAWERALADVPEMAEPARLRGGAPRTGASMLAEMKRPDLSAPEVMARADELFLNTGRYVPVEYGAFGVSLEGPLSELSRLVR